MLRIGTDCSGIEAPIQALDKLKIKYIHSFSSDIDEYVRKSIKANYKPKKLYSDMRLRDINKVPKVDIYVCGFPCQSFSMIGNRLGVKDNRGKIIYHCIKYINKKKPKIFILENVKGLLTIDKGKTMSNILKELRKSNIYHIDYKLLNAKDYGIPQNRNRLFIVGIKKSLLVNKTAKTNEIFPNPIKLRKSCWELVDMKNKKKGKLGSYAKVLKRFDLPKKIILNCNTLYFQSGYTGKKPNLMKNTNIIPCIDTRGKMWIHPIQRWMTTKELLKFQGFNNKFEQVVSKHQLKKQIGNSMCVNVLSYLIRKILRLINKKIN